MPTVTMRSFDPCPTCGYGVEWFQVCSVRVNKRSLRSKSSIGAASATRCPECEFETRRDDWPRRWQLDPEDAARVAEIRERRFADV